MRTFDIGDNACRGQGSCEYTGKPLLIVECITMTSLVLDAYLLWYNLKAIIVLETTAVMNFTPATKVMVTAIAASCVKLNTVVLYLTKLDIHFSCRSDWRTKLVSKTISRSPL
jgi:hypothetical protein